MWNPSNPNQSHVTKIDAYVNTYQFDIETGVDVSSWDTTSGIAWGYVTGIKLEVPNPRLVDSDGTIDFISDAVADYPYEVNMYRTALTKQSVPNGASTQGLGLDPGDEHFFLSAQQATTSMTGDWEYDTDARAYRYTFKIPEQTTLAAAQGTSVLGDNFDADLSLTLYTNSSEEGISQANLQPPVSFTTAEFQGHYFYANQFDPAARIMTMTEQMDSGETFRVGHANNTYTGLNGGTPNDNQFNRNPFEINLVGDGYDTVVPQIARNLIRTINSYNSTGDTSKDFSANYESDYQGTQGIFSISANYYSKDTLTFTLSSGMDDAIDGVETGDTSEQNIQKNRLRYSKYEQPDAVPFANEFATSSDAEVLALLTTPERMLVFTDAGLWQITGITEANFNLRLIDPSIELRSPSSVAFLENKVFALVGEGIITLDNSTKPISYNWEDVLYRKMGYANFFSACHAVAHEKAHEYKLWVPKTSDAQPEMECYTINTKTGCWYYSDTDADAAFVAPVTKDLFVGSRGIVDSGNTYYRVSRERRQESSEDYVDERITVTYTSHETEPVEGYPTTITITYPTNVFDTEPLVGWVLEQDDDSDLRWLVESVEDLGGNSYKLTLDTNVSSQTEPTAGTFRIYKSIATRWHMTPYVGNGLGTIKQFKEYIINLRKPSASVVTIGVIGDIQGVEGQTEIRTSEVWGGDSFGDGDFGTSKEWKVYVIRSYVDRGEATSRAIRITFEHNRAFEYYEVIEVSMNYELISTKVSK